MKFRSCLLNVLSFKVGQEDGEKNTDDVSCLHQMSQAIIAAFRTQNALAKMVLDEFFEACEVNENEVVRYSNYYLQFVVLNFIYFCSFSK